MHDIGVHTGQCHRNPLLAVLCCWNILFGPVAATAKPWDGAAWSARRWSEIPAGRFRMGSVGFYPEEGPVREVEVVSRSTAGRLRSRGWETLAEETA